METWVSVNGYEGLYEISDEGNVRSCDRLCNARSGSTQIRKGKILSPGQDSCGYLQVCLTDKNGKRKMTMVHLLVATHFVPNPNAFPEVNHINWIKTYNQAWNLEWVTRSDNVRHAHIKRKLDDLWK